MSNLNRRSLKVLLILSLLTLALRSQTIIFTVLPDSTYNQSTASSQACFANCQSCQTNTNQCEECYSPYFVKAQDGSCQLASSYTLESSNNEILSGAAFTPTAQSWSNSAVTACQPSAIYLNTPLYVLGPFSSGKTVSYIRSISFHQYVVIRFGLIKMNWDPTSVLSIIITDQNNKIVVSNNITNTANVPNQILCSKTKVDQRVSVQFQLQDNSITTININFTYTSSVSSGQWAIATWMLMTGMCDPSCSNCTFSVDPTQCIGCNSFFITGSDQTCSQCFTGFQMAVSNGINQCVKCPIQYQTCSPGQSACFYANISNQLNASNCVFSNDSDYSSIYDVNTNQFPGSLMTVSGNPATYQCGSYSLVGLAQRGDSITRIFTTMPPHYFMSITFNIMVVDQVAATQANLFVIIVDNIILEASYITTQGISNTCGGSALEAFVTYPATKFYPHSNLQNVNLTITSNATNWGIRNLRVAYQICDSTCINCSPEGCTLCQGYFQLSNLVCQQCPSGYGFLPAASPTTNHTCIQCPLNCISCIVQIFQNSTTALCTTCSEAYFLFQNSCNLKTNVASALPISSSPIGSSAGSWNITAPTNISNLNCNINLPSINNSTTVNFTLSQNYMSSLIKIPQSHYQIIVEFYLIRIDNWDPSDTLNLYLNDLLMMSKNYSSFGNNICAKDNQGDFISFESMIMQDTNNTLSVYFQVVTSTGQNRVFGVSNFEVYPVGCQSCNNYPFNYQIKYNYDESLNVHVEFNRVYAINNATLFQQIFWLLLNGNRLNYNILSNDTVTYILQSFPNTPVLDGNLTLICQYPQLVNTDITNTINQNPFFNSSRLLQSPQYSILKTIDNNQSYTMLNRYTPVDNPSTINGIRIFFEVISRMTIYIGFAFFFIGCQTSCTHLMHNLQKIWIHIFVASLAIPSALKYSLTGFREIQNQNIAINPTVWEQDLPTALYYNTPAYYQQYYSDVGFMRNIYNIAIAFAILIIYSIVAHYVLKHCNIGRGYRDSIFFRHMRITFVKRPFFVFNSIIFYQYLTLVLACTLQFLGFMNQTNQGSFGGINAAGAVVAFVIATIYPLFHLYYLRSKQNSLGPQKSIQYNNRYHQIFYRFLPADLWSQSSLGITFAEQIYNVYRFGEIWWFCIIVTGMHNNPEGQCFLLMITNFFHFIVVLFSSLNFSIYFRIMKIIEQAFYIGLEIIILVCASQQSTLTTRSLNTLGSVGIALLFAIIFVSVIRSIYTFWMIYWQYNTNDEKVKAQYIQRRNQQCFSSKVEELLPSET